MTGGIKEDGTKDSIGMTAVSCEAGFVSESASVNGEVEGGWKKMDVGLGCAQSGILVDGVVAVCVGTVNLATELRDESTGRNGSFSEKTMHDGSGKGA